MTALKFNLDIDAEIQKLRLPPAKVAKPANRDSNTEKISSFSRISKPLNGISTLAGKSIPIKDATILHKNK